MKWLTKAAPMWLVLVLVAALVGLSVAYAMVLTTEKYTVVGGVKVTVSEELTMTEIGTMAVPSGVAGAKALTGTFTATDIILRGNAIGELDYVFKCKLSEIADVTPASKAYTVTLYQDGVIVGEALTVTSDDTKATKADGDALCYWSLGSDLPAGVYYIAVSE